MKKYLAIDIGTTNWKVAVFDENGQMVDIERVATKTHIDKDGNSFYNPFELWKEISNLIKTVTGRVGGVISAVSVTSMGEAVVAVDDEGREIGNIIAWFDNRSYKEAKYLEEKFTAKKLFSITGLDVNPIFSLPKILWVKNNLPNIYDKAHKWLQMADYILFKLTKEYVTDYTLASRTLAFDVVQNKWSTEILNELNISAEVFPTIVESGTVIGFASKELENETGITLGAKIVVGGNDHPCASIATGVIGGKKILDSSGTAESFIYISEKNATPLMEFKGQRVCRYLQKDRYAIWGGIICSGRSFDWAYDIFSSSNEFNVSFEKKSYDEILSKIKNIKGMEKGVFFYPHLRGAGAPYWNSKITGSFLGLKDDVTAQTMLKSVLEGLSCQARMIVEMEESLVNAKIDTLCVVGGSSKNLIWQQIKANVTQKDIEVSKEPEATSLGAAMLASIGDGEYKNIEEISEVVSKRNFIIHPEENRNYDVIYDLYKRGYESLKIINEEIFDYIKGI